MAKLAQPVSSMERIAALLKPVALVGQASLSNI